VANVFLPGGGAVQFQLAGEPENNVKHSLKEKKCCLDIVRPTKGLCVTGALVSFGSTEEEGFPDRGNPRRPGSPGRILGLNGVRNLAGRVRGFEQRGVEKLEGVISVSVVICVSRAVVTGPVSGCRFPEVDEAVKLGLRGEPWRFEAVGIFVECNGDLKAECRNGIFIFGGAVNIGAESGVSGVFRALGSVVRAGLLSFRWEAFLKPTFWICFEGEVEYVGASCLPSKTESSISQAASLAFAFASDASDGKINGTFPNPLIDDAVVKEVIPKSVDTSAEAGLNQSS
jgi:hypothetical protein